MEDLGRLEVSGEDIVVHHQPPMALQVSVAVTAVDTTEDRYSMKQKFWNKDYIFGHYPSSGLYLKTPFSLFFKT